MEAGVAPRRASAGPGIAAGGVIAIAGIALLLTFLFMDIVDYSYTVEPDDTFALPGEVAPEPELREDQYKGKDVRDESLDGAGLFVWTIAAGGVAILGGLIAMIPAVARRFWAVGVPIAVVMAAWVIYSRTWFNDEVENLNRTGIGADLSFYAAILIFVVAIGASIVVAVRNRGAQP